MTTIFVGQENELPDPMTENGLQGQVVSPVFPSNSNATVYQSAYNPIHVVDPSLDHLRTSPTIQSNKSINSVRTRTLDDSYGDNRSRITDGYGLYDSSGQSMRGGRILDDNELQQAKNNAVKIPFNFQWAVIPRTFEQNIGDVDERSEIEPWRLVSQQNGNKNRSEAASFIETGGAKAIKMLRQVGVNGSATSARATKGFLTGIPAAKDSVLGFLDEFNTTTKVVFVSVAAIAVAFVASKFA